MHLLLVDGSGYVFRAYHALPQLSRKTDGLPTWCVLGFCNMLYKLTEDMEGGGKRDAGFDGSQRPASQLAILPNTTHYNLMHSPLLTEVATAFLTQ